MTKEQLEKSQKPVPALFASAINSDCHKVDTQASGFSYQYGIPSTYASLTGKKVCRGDVNGIGRAITQMKWFNQLGGYYTFDTQVSELIGGYPQGAVLKYKDEETGFVREVMSLIPDNTFNFVESPEFINDEYWTYVDNVPIRSFRPLLIPVVSEVTVGNLRVNEELTVERPSQFMIATGADTLDCTDDGSDYYLYLDVKSLDREEFFTAGLILFLPSQTSVITQGIVQDPKNTIKDTKNNDFSPIGDRLQQGFHAYSSPSPIQIFLSAGDTVKLSGNRVFTPIDSESFQYWIFPLTY